VSEHELVYRTIYVRSQRLLVEIRQLNVYEYELTGTPAPEKPAEVTEEVANLAELNKVYASLGLMELSFGKHVLDRALKIFERPATMGWRRISRVHRWH
jgi:hypothetical protein